MSKKSNRFGHDPQENLVSLIPALLAGMSTLSLTVITTILLYPAADSVILIGYAIVGCVYLACYYWLYTISPNKTLHAWINAAIVGLGLGVLTYLIPQELHYLIYTLVFIAVLSISVISRRGPAYLLIMTITAFHVAHLIEAAMPLNELVIHGGLVVATIITAETIQQLKKLSQNQMNRLEVINRISENIVSTIETKQLLSLLNAAFQNALDADTYYIGIQKGDELHMELFYDDGEYFSDVRVKMEGTLSSWVIKNQKPLFLPDLRTTVKLEGVNFVLLGKPKGSLSWMGVPMKGSHVNGVMAIASYRPNAFNRSDHELLSNIAQRATLALDNTYRHALVEEQARLDSLTRVYNHGYFIQRLREQAEDCRAQAQPLSLIMLDIDYFKQYNDIHGHLVGDEMLINLCTTIRSHIKQTDAVGRWGGEEFAISLPNSDGEQALQVAERIRETLASIKVKTNKLADAPSPTVSMGIAVYPTETSDITKLIDLADSRLYIAKERGRNQIEPAPASHENIKSN